MKEVIILVPYPAQGHVTPMVKLGQAISAHGLLQPVLIIPDSIHARICDLQVRSESEFDLVYMPVPDDRAKQSDFFTIEKAMENEMPQHLERIILELQEANSKVACLVVDLLASWAFEVGRKQGLRVAGFWPAMLATYRLLASIPDMVKAGFISPSGIPVEDGAVCSLPAQPQISTQELPWLIGDATSRTARFQFWNRTIQRSATLSYLLVNSFTDELLSCGNAQDTMTGEIMQWNKTTPRRRLFARSTKVLPIGTVSSMRVELNTATTFWEEDTGCIDWLNRQKPSSVLYISFGSWVSPLGEAKIESLALGLEATAQPFLWVLPSAWRKGLPEGFVNRISGQGKLVFWAPQREVLKNKAVGCYLTHCGWNSTMEAIQFQKKLLCYPVAGDQNLNCRYIVDLWKIGVRLFSFEQQYLKEGIDMVIRNEEMSRELAKLKQRTTGAEALSRAADNLTAFINHLNIANNTGNL